MGTKFSSAVGNSIGQNDFLNDLCGAEPIRNHDEFWNKFAFSSLLSISQAIISEQSSSSESISSIGKVARAVSSSSVLNVGDYFPLSLLHPEIMEKHLFKYASLMRMFYSLISLIELRFIEFYICFGIIFISHTFINGLFLDFVNIFSIYNYTHIFTI